MPILRLFYALFGLAFVAAGATTFVPDWRAAVSELLKSEWVGVVFMGSGLLLIVAALNPWIVVKALGQKAPSDYDRERVQRLLDHTKETGDLRRDVGDLRERVRALEADLGSVSEENAELRSPERTVERQRQIDARLAEQEECDRQRVERTQLAMRDMAGWMQLCRRRDALAEPCQVRIGHVKHALSMMLTSATLRLLWERDDRWAAQIAPTAENCQQHVVRTRSLIAAMKDLRDELEPVHVLAEDQWRAPPDEVMRHVS